MIQKVIVSWERMLGGFLKCSFMFLILWLSFSLTWGTEVGIERDIAKESWFCGLHQFSVQCRRCGNRCPPGGPSQEPPIFG